VSSVARAKPKTPTPTPPPAPAPPVKLITTTLFDRDVKRQAKRGKALGKLHEVIETLRNRRPLDRKYKDHSLGGERIVESASPDPAATSRFVVWWVSILSLASTMGWDAYLRPQLDDGSPSQSEPACARCYEVVGQRAFAFERHSRLRKRIDLRSLRPPEHRRRLIPESLEDPAGHWGAGRVELLHWVGPETI
jgi:hypothetical protein